MIMEQAIYAIVLMSTALSCTTRVKTTNDDVITESEVRAIIEQYDHAWNKKDSLTVKSVLSDQYVYFSSLGETNKKGESLKFLRDTAYVIHSAQRPEVEIIISGNVATVNSRWIGDLSWKGQSIHDNQRCGLTIAKHNGKIEIIAEHCVAIKQD